MKNQYPEYSREGIDSVDLYNELSKEDKKLLDDFITYCSISAGKSKVRDVKTNILQFRDIIQIPFKKVDLKVLREFLAILEQSNRTQWTKNGMKNYLKRFFRWMHKDWSERFDNFRDVKTPSAFNEKKINENTLITPDELKAMCHSATSYKEKALVMMLYESGARPQEIRQLKWKDIVFNDDGTAKVHLYSGKTESARAIIIKDAVVTLKDWEQNYSFPLRTQQDFVFPSSVKRDSIISDGNFSLIIKRLGQKAGIKRNIFPYLFRHSRLTELHKILPEQIHKKFAGHTKDSRMTAVYSHISSEDVASSLLSKVYHVEKITAEQQNKYQKEIDALKKDVMQLKAERVKTLKDISEVNKLDAEFNPFMLKTIKEMQNNIVKIQKALQMK